MGSISLSDVNTRLGTKLTAPGNVFTGNLQIVGNATITGNALTGSITARTIDALASAGIAWTLRTSAVDNNWYSVAWGGPVGSQVFVEIFGAASRGAGRLDRSCSLPWRIQERGIA